MPNYRLEEGNIQWQFFHSRAPIQVFSGSYGNGKSTGMAVKGLKLATLYPGSNGLIARSTYPKLNDTMRKIVLEWCPRTWVAKRPTQDDNTLYLKNGSAINFRYIAQRGKSSGDGSTTSNLLSATYDWIAVDQIEDPEIVHKDFVDLMGRMRGNTSYRPPEGEEHDATMPSSGPRWIMIGANPSRNWFFREIVQPFMRWKERGFFSDKLIVDERTGLPLMELFNGDIYSNAANLEPDYIRNQEAVLKGQARDRFLLGKWLAYEGLVHDVYDETVHALSQAECLEHLEGCKKRHVEIKTLEAYDFGLASPTCYLLGFVDDFGRVIVLDGFYEPGLHYTEHRTKIEEVRDRYWEFGLEYRDPIRADPAIFRRQVIAGRRDTGDTIAKLLKDDGLNVAPATNDINHGIAKVNAYLCGLPHIPHVTTGLKPGPLMYFNHDLGFIHDEISEYYWQKNTFGDVIDKPQDHNDHAMNTIKYLMSKLPDASRIVIPSKLLPPKWRMWHEEDAEKEYGFTR